MPVMQNLLTVLENPLSLTTIQAPSNHNDRKEKNEIRNRLLVVFHACSDSLPYLFFISSPSPTRGRIDARPREVRLALALPERPPTLCPMLTCLIGAAARAILAVNLTTSPLSHTVLALAQPCGQVQHAILVPPIMGPSKRL